MSSTNLQDVDWSALPRPMDDGDARHLTGAALPDVMLTATDGSIVSLARLLGRTVVFVYPMTGKPGVALPEGWDQIPGARGCTPQTCAFRDLFAEMQAAGADHVYGFSTQNTTYQQEVAEGLHLPFQLLSDSKLEFSHAAQLPLMAVEDMTLAKRLTLIVDDGTVKHVFYPVFPPNRNAGDVLAWLQSNKYA